MFSDFGRSLPRFVRISLTSTGLAICPLIGGLLCAQTGQITVAVTDEQGVPVQGAEVFLLARPAPLPNPGPGTTRQPAPGTIVQLAGTQRRSGHSRGQTDSLGAFKFSSLEPGYYSLCARVSGRSLADSCTWDLSPPIVSSGGAPSTTAVIRLKPSRALRIRINDAAGLLAGERFPGERIMVAVGPAATGFLIPAVDSTDSSGRTYAIDVPAETDLHVALRGAGWLITDAAGKEIGRATRDRIPVRAPRGLSSPHVVTVQVKGPRPVPPRRNR